MSLISNSGSDERGKSSGGKAGDQTGKEWKLISWYSSPWFCVLRYPDTKVADLIADMARKAALNDNIGYDQNQRTTFWRELEKVGYEPDKIVTPCEADCSAGVTAIIKGAGYRTYKHALMELPETLYTGNLRQYLVNAGFQCLTDSKYLTSDAYLLPGDVLLHDNKHTAINLDRGSKAGGGSTVDIPMTVLRKGSKDPEVKTLQRLLNAMGYRDENGKELVVDQSFGKKVEYCVKSFQSKNGLEADGVVGRATWTKVLKG